MANIRVVQGKPVAPPPEVVLTMSVSEAQQLFDSIRADSSECNLSIYVALEQLTRKNGDEKPILGRVTEFQEYVLRYKSSHKPK